MHTCCALYDMCACARVLALEHGVTCQRFKRSASFPPSLPPLSPNPPRGPLSLQLDDEQVQAILYSAANANRRCLAWSFRALSLSLFLSFRCSFLCSLHLFLSPPPNLVVSDQWIEHETLCKHISSNPGLPLRGAEYVLHSLDLR